MARGHHSEHDDRRKVTRDHHNARIEDLDNLGFAANIYGESMHLDPRMDEDRYSRSPEYSYDSTGYDEYDHIEPWQEETGAFRSKERGLT
jgi:hypothetical protein